MSNQVLHYEYKNKILYAVLEVNGEYKRYSLSNLMKYFDYLVNLGFKWKVIYKIIGLLKACKTIDLGPNDHLMLPVYQRICNCCGRKYSGTDMDDPFCNDACKSIYFNYRYDIFGIPERKEIPHWSFWIENGWWSDRKKVGGLNHLYLHSI